MNASPGPDDCAYVATGSSNELAKKPTVAKTAKPANTPVKQSHETTMHICLPQNRVVLDKERDKIEFTEKNYF